MLTFFIFFNNHFFNQALYHPDWFYNQFRIELGSRFKTPGQVLEQGAGRRKSAACAEGCEYFEKVGNAAIGARMGFERASKREPRETRGRARRCKRGRKPHDATGFLLIVWALLKCSILFQFKQDEDFYRRNTLSISRIET